MLWLAALPLNRRTSSLFELRSLTEVSSAPRRERELRDDALSADESFVGEVVLSTRLTVADSLADWLYALLYARTLYASAAYDPSEEILLVLITAPA
jgi:hypothetical protein